MKPADTLALLREFYNDKASLRQRHAAAARHVPNYDFNNTYQYIISREDVQIGWLQDAIAGLGGTVDITTTPGEGTEVELRVPRKLP